MKAVGPSAVNIRRTWEGGEARVTKRCFIKKPQVEMFSLKTKLYQIHP